MATKYEIPTYGHFVDGEWEPADSTIPVYDKYTEKEIGRIGDATREEVSRAVANALDTFQQILLSPRERYEILMRAAAIFKERKEDFVQTIVSESGKVIKDARAEVERGIQTLIAAAEESKRIAGRGIPLAQSKSDGKLAFTLRMPVGVIGAITPFNFPFNLVMHKLAPAIAAGNTVVLKPAEKTPLTACKMVDVLIEAGLPKGVVNVVNGTGATAGLYLLQDDRIAMFTFTGSPAVGQHVKRVTGIRKVTLELGNNSPNIVHKDVADLNRAVQLCVTRGYSNAGQACISVQRIYVHRDIYDEFLRRSVELTKSLRVGNPRDPETDVGPLISEREAARVESWIEEARAGGAQVVCGGTRDGALFYPTILTNVTSDMKVVCEEVFAPVISITPYDDIDQVFRWVNDTRFGLQVGVFTSDLQLAMRAARELRFGGVIINDVSTYRADVMPYGGVKDSGVGKEGPRYAIEEMTDERLVVIDLA
ncbi:aldehyde dehydrogenase family protein [Alicyclobacillus kakegawensis]|uniref:aldehyde dehydrogenase family protein n=1 Tax=Alicyclobacillus kakegawensis TaxID=392012 RepID=UPI00083051CB|nr:aldehyde dehydrogenase family protein [Alicyclobacillus kakegawensis]